MIKKKPQNYDQLILFTWYLHDDGTESECTENAFLEGEVGKVVNV